MQKYNPWHQVSFPQIFSGVMSGVPAVLAMHGLEELAPGLIPSCISLLLFANCAVPAWIIFKFLIIIRLQHI